MTESMQRRIARGGQAWSLSERLLSAPGLRRLSQWTGKSLARIPERLLVIGFDGVESLRSGRSFRELWPGIQNEVVHGGGLLEYPPKRSFWVDGERNAMVGVMLGVDLLRRSSSFALLETNHSAALRTQRRELYGETDPFLDRLAEAARDGGFRRLVVYGRPWTLGQRQDARAAAQQTGVEVRLASHPIKDRRPHHPMVCLPTPLPRDTLIVLAAFWNSPVVRMLHDKRSVQRWFDEEGQKDGDQLVASIVSLDVLERMFESPGDSWPNLVVKGDRSDCGDAVVMGRFSSLAKATERLRYRGPARRPGCLRESSWLARSETAFLGGEGAFFQPFLPPPQLPDGRLMTSVRSHVLVSPRLTRYLSAHAIVTSSPYRPVAPDTLIRSPHPLIGSFGAGTVGYARLDRGDIAETDPLLAKETEAATRLVGERAVRAVKRRFVVEESRFE